MNVVIIEDEEFATRRLESMINEIDLDIQIVSKLESVVGSVNWFKNNSVPDLIFMDIHLEDNLSFAIFDSITIQCPIVFTSATDEKSTHLFKKHNIDYLLKPIVMDELVKIIEKYKYSPELSKGTIDSSFFKSIVNK
jgi:DNA-binding LytR/AlgR family response regulator